MWTDDFMKSMQPLFDVVKELKESVNYKVLQNELKSIQSIMQNSQNQMIKMSKQISKTLDSVRLPVIELSQSLKSMFASLNLNKIFNDSVFEKEIITIDDESRKQIVNDSIAVVEKINKQRELTFNEKKSWLRKFFGFLKKVLSSGLFALLLFFVSPIYQELYDNNIKPAIYYNQYQKLQNQNENLDLRIIQRDTPLYSSKKMKSILTFLSKYEVVEVLEYHKDKIKIRVHNSDEIGWMYKKYAKK